MRKKEKARKKKAFKKGDESETERTLKNKNGIPCSDGNVLDLGK